MSRTSHHRSQKHAHNGHDYGARYRCNRMYGAGYGAYSRSLAHAEMRNDSKVIIKMEIDDVDI